MSAVEATTIEGGRDFIRDIVAADLQSGRRKEVVTRFPPEPNGYLHIGHAKSIGLNFGVAQEFGGRCHLRFDDTNPTKEEQEYIDAIGRDVRWLGFDWNAHLYHASDYFAQLYAWVEHLIRTGKAYGDDQPVPSRPRQYEFARLNLSYKVLSKRGLTELVRGGHVSGWDGPRMPTLAGLRRRGVPPAAIREFVRRIGVAKANSVVDVAMFEHSVREVLNRTALRRMAVLRPLKIVIENYPQGQSEELEAVNHPDEQAAG